MRWRRAITATITLGLALPLWCAAAGKDPVFKNVSIWDITVWLPRSQPVARIRYADTSPVQFGDLRLPHQPAPRKGYPVVVFVHGGRWRSDFSKDYTAPFVEKLTAAGLATWDLEFRRIGNPGGGYPGTFADVGAGADHLRELARRYPLDIDRVVAVGHSSGGHLALWLAGRNRLPEASELRSVDPLKLAGVVSIAGVNDLEQSLTRGGRADVLTLLGVERLDEAGERLASADPARLLPFGIPQTLLLGSKDDDWRIAMTADYAKRALRAGDRVVHRVIKGPNHLDVVDPTGPFPELVANAVFEIMAERE